MKVIIISDDLWGFCKYIHLHLLKKNVESSYINGYDYIYKYRNKFDRILNFFQKTLLNKNIKKMYRKNRMFEKLNDLYEIQDYILFINPGTIDDSIIELARKKAKKLIAYNYDSLLRVPISKNTISLFDEIYSFDDQDIKNDNQIKKITNYIYQNKREIEKEFKAKAFIILSYDKKRSQIINKIANELDRNLIKSYHFILIGKKKFNINKNIIVNKKALSIEEVNQEIKNSEILIDIIKVNQVGLSFRIFEAMAHQKKLITTNANIKNYDFYNENNILVIDSENPIIPQDFLNNKYIPLSDDIYNKYTLDTWCKTVFNIN